MRTVLLPDLQKYSEHVRVDAWYVKNGFVILSKFTKNAVPFEMHTVGRRLTVALILK